MEMHITYVLILTNHSHSASGVFHIAFRIYFWIFFTSYGALSIEVAFDKNFPYSKIVLQLSLLRQSDQNILVCVSAPPKNCSDLLSLEIKNKPDNLKQDIN